MRRSYFSVLFFGACLVVSCRNPNKQVTNTANSPTVSENIQMLEMAMDTCWQNMLASDRAKFENMNRLIQELKLIEGSDPDKLEAILLAIKRMDSIRYTPKSISDSKSIDQFDAATNEVWAKLRTEVQRNKNSEKYQIINQLISEIQQADDSVLFYRKSYDHRVDTFNGFLKQNKKDLKRNYPGYDSLKPFPVFRLVQ